MSRFLPFIAQPPASLLLQRLGARAWLAHRIVVAESLLPALMRRPGWDVPADTSTFDLLSAAAMAPGPAKEAPR